MHANKMAWQVLKNEQKIAAKSAAILLEAKVEPKF